MRILGEPPADREGAFTDVEADWASVTKRLHARVAAWGPAIEAIAADENALRKEGRWVHGRADTLGVLGLARDEIRHSRMVAWLLDPCGLHGLGTRVLEGVLEAAFGTGIHRAALALLGNARVACEVARDDCRIDILVSAPGLTLLIENKVDALESDRQCDAYFELYAHEPGARFILLTPEGHPPRSASGTALEEFRPLGYPALRRIVAAALAATPPGARGRPVAEDYLRTLTREFR